MEISKQLAHQLSTLYFGGNWTSSNFKDNLSDINWQQATQKVFDFNTIAQLVFHTNYFIDAAVMVLKGGPLDAHDKYSFDVQAINSQKDWDELRARTFALVNEFVLLLEDMNDEKLGNTFVLEKYGSYFRNLCGIIEHSHYHLGQIVLIKKLILSKN